MRRRPVVVALSGLDGAGKSSQADLLASRLRERGHRVEVHWMALGHSGLQRRLKRLAAPLTSRTGTGGAPVLTAGGATRSRRHHHPLVAGAWVTMLAVIYGVHFRRVARRSGGDVVVFDRYTLDALAQSRYFYDPGRRFTLARALLSGLAPSPHRAYLLAVPAELALERKQEQYDAGQLALQARLLEQEARSMRVEVLDGAQPPAELSERLIGDALSSLSSPARR
jgi:thymidylate kinase